MSKKGTSGRKPSTDKKVQLAFYVRESTIKKLKGMVKAREKAEQLINEYLTQ